MSKTILHGPALRRSLGKAVDRIRQNTENNVAVLAWPLQVLVVVAARADRRTSPARTATAGTAEGACCCAAHRRHAARDEEYTKAAR